MKENKTINTWILKRQATTDFLCLHKVCFLNGRNALWEDATGRLAFAYPFSIPEQT